MEFKCIVCSKAVSVLIKGSRVCEHQYEWISHRPFIFSSFLKNVSLVYDSH